MNKVKLVVTVLLLMYSSTESYAIISGTITSTSGSAIADALVTYTNINDEEQVYTAYTDESGYYEIDLTDTAVEDDMPTLFSLGQNYPNPFNPKTTIPFKLNADEFVTLTIYNIMGQRVRNLMSDHLQAGNHTVIWDGMDEQGNHLSAGVYFYQLQSRSQNESRKMLLLDGGISHVQYAPGFSARPATADETVYCKMNIRAYGYFDYTAYDITLTDGNIYDYNLTEMIRINDVPVVIIPGGTFSMGDVEQVGRSDERPVHTVTISSFQMSAYEITNAQYATYLNEAYTANSVTASVDEVTGLNGEWSGNRYIYLAGNYSKYPENDCKIEFIDNEFSVKTGYEDWPVNWVTWFGAKAFAEHYGFDLPREAEWEYASRWGNHQYRYGTVDGTLDNSNANSDVYDHPVAIGSYPANPFGLHDMSGNVAEYCVDWYGDYSSGSVTDPVNTLSGDDRVGRGGSWASSAQCRSAARDYIFPYVVSSAVGFRVVRRLEMPVETYTITGTVFFEGSGLSHVIVNQNGLTTETDENGTYHFTGVHNYVYTLTFEKSGYSFDTPVVRVTVHGEDVTVPDVIASNTASTLPEGLDLVPIPGGTFQMGDEVGDLNDDCLPVHTVTVSSFEMSAHEITNAQYALYLNEAYADDAITIEEEIIYGASGDWNGEVYIYLSIFNYGTPDAESKLSFDGETFTVESGFEDWPVNWVSWYGAEAFAEHYGLDLPREAEWEYAARWGDHQYLYGTNDGTLDATNANCKDTVGHPVAVGSYPSNPFGIYDLSGNMIEWCFDRYSEYTDESVTDPTGGYTDFYRVFRGGSWDADYDCRSAYRGNMNPSYDRKIGFRVVRRP